ncbi:unnamed protein product [Rotaria socialis]|uniref:NAD(P)(+)--arginine ADP-ribosyltransferase n=2 Tax=Rotaria socialis TaxID=392032 RepID=A0A821NPV6_9BILA|nr:unnamed protein product [Rotaria socialis]CAF4788112.1 unnamed protein product [Rotaria socialis]
MTKRLNDLKQSISNTFFKRNIQRRNLEFFSIAWYHDSTDDIKDEALLKLRQKINGLLEFLSINELHEYFETTSADDNQILLIVSAKFTSDLLAIVEQLEQIISIFIFSGGIQEEDVKCLVPKCSKIKGYYSTIEDIIQNVENELTRLSQLEDLEISIDIYDRIESGENSNDKAKFLWLRLLIDVLIKIEDQCPPEKILTEYERHISRKLQQNDEISFREFTDKYIAKIPVRQFVAVCKQHCEGNRAQLAKLMKFEETYTPSQSLLWFTQEPFIFRVLNKALRFQHVDILYQYRFLIRDLATQLSTQKNDEMNFHVYRGQVMTNEELQQVTKPTNQFVRFNSFLSTSRDREIAQAFAISSLIDESRQQMVLFDIEINSQIDDTRTYADISQWSTFPEEQEILFMCGSVFRLTRVVQHESGLKIIGLALCNENDDELRRVYEDLKHEYLSDARNISLLDLGNILKDTNRTVEAAKYYFELMNVVEDGDPLIQRCLHNLALLRYKQCDYESTLEYLQIALDLEVVSSEREESFICSIYNWIGNVFLMRQNFDRALENYNEGLKHKSKIDSRDQLGEIKLYANIANVYTYQKRYELALEKHLECLAMKQEILQDFQHPMIAASYVHIGIVYTKLKRYQEAIDILEKALNIQCKVLGTDHLDVGVTLYNLGVAYDEQKNYDRASQYYLEAVENFPINHAYFKRVQVAMKEIENKTH